MSRRVARETALQVLFQIDMTKGDPGQALEYVFKEFAVPEASKGFTRRLVEGTLENLDQINSTIQTVAKEWNLDRMAGVDRNILRLACFELLYCSDIPGSATVNEAIELAKIYSGEEAGKFVNGILGTLLAKTGRGREAAAATSMEETLAPVPKTEQADVRPLAEDDH